MNDLSGWWSESPSTVLDEAISFVNSAQRRNDSIARCDDLCKALNKFWNGFYLYRIAKNRLTEKERERRSDIQAFTQLLIAGMSPSQKNLFVETDSLRRLVEFTPRIMNHNILIEERCNPLDIPEQLSKKASEQHRKLLNAYARSVGSADTESLLNRTADLLFVVRSNIAHSEKTRHGPDLDKAKRDRAVAELTAAVIDDLFDILLDRPACRLAVYGTLAPSQPNASVLNGIVGEWRDGEVRGEVEDMGGLPVFFWRGQSPVRVKVLDAPLLKAEFDRLDRFEGPSYRRILVPVESAGRCWICNIYEGVGDV